MKLVEFRIPLHELRHLEMEGSLEIYLAEKIKGLKIQDYTPVMQMYDKENDVYIVRQYQYSIKDSLLLLYGVIKAYLRRFRGEHK
jgi:hypothetical protein